MIESIKTTVPQPSEISYPCLMESIPSGNIWLMTAPREGAVVSSSTSSNWKIGETSVHLNMDLLSLYHDDITLRNKQ